MIVKAPSLCPSKLNVLENPPEVQEVESVTAPPKITGWLLPEQVPLTIKLFPFAALTKLPGAGFVKFTYMGGKVGVAVDIGEDVGIGVDVRIGVNVGIDVPVGEGEGKGEPSVLHPTSATATPKSVFTTSRNTS
mgnify:CR=1 FL=1